MNKEAVGFMGLGAIVSEAVEQYLNDDYSWTLAAISSRQPASVYQEKLRWNTDRPQIPIRQVQTDIACITIDGHPISFQQFSFSRHPDTKELQPLDGLTIWKDQHVALVLEATGQIKNYQDAVKHIEVAGALAVVIPSPAGEGVQSISIGINEKTLDLSSPVFATESCTTNCAVPILKVLQDQGFQIENIRGLTTHTRTDSNKLLDGPTTHKDPRRSRAATANIIPTTTGASKGILRLLPDLSENNVPVIVKCNRVPVDDVSRLDLFITLKNNRGITTEALMDLFTDYANGPLSNVMTIAVANSVSRMYTGSKYRSIIDPNETYVQGNDIVVGAWYANVSGPTKGALDLISFVLNRL